MSDSNNDFGNNSQEQTDKLNQNTNPYSQSEDGSTYWESNEVQSSFDIQPGQSTNNTDFNQKVQDFTYDEFKNNQYKLNQKKKPRKKIFVAIIVVILLLGSAATAYGFSSTVRNSIDLLLKSPKDYYEHIENKSLESSMDKSSAFMNMNKAKNSATNVTATLSYDKETVGAMLQSYLGMTISDFEASLGIPLDSVGFDIISANSEKEMYQKTGLELNNIDIISGEFFFDYVSKEMLLYFPELSAAYLDLDMSELGEEDFDLEGFSDAMNKTTSDSTIELIKRYGRLITEEIKDVELTKKEQLTVGDITVEANLLTVSLYPETMKNILSSVLEEAKNDEYILNLLPLMEMTKEEYQAEIDDAILDAKNKFDGLPQDDKLMVMNVYVGSEGDILGRKITIAENNDTLGFFYVEKNNKGEYEFFMNPDDENDIRLTGSHTKEKGAYTGGLTFRVSDNTEPIEFDIEYEGLKLEHRNNHIYTYGSLSLSSYAMMGMEVVLELDVKDETQLATIKLNMGRTSLVALETSTKYLEDFTIPRPDKNADIYDALTESDEYALTMDIDAYISSLSDRLGVDLEDLLGGFLPMY